MKKIKITCKGSRSVPIEKLERFQGNLKELSEKEFEKLKGSILKYGFSFPVFVWENNIIDGHQRVMTVLELLKTGEYEIDDVPVVDIEAMDKREAAEKLLVLNSQYAKMTYEGLYEFGTTMEIDFESVALDLNLPDIDIENFLEGYVRDVPPGGDDDNIPDPPKKAKTKTGDLYLLGDHRLLCGDSTKVEDVERLMDGSFSELLFTSPPYSDMRDYHGNKDLSINKLINFISVFTPFAENQIINLGLQRKNHEIVQYWDDYIKKAKECGYKFLSWNVWSREGMGGSISNMSAMFRMEHEWLFVFGKEPKKINNTVKNKTHGKHTGITNRQKDGTTKKAKHKIVKDFGRLSSVVSMCYGHSTKHPAVFPVALPEEYIKALTIDKDIVTEPFCGSGSTMLACEKTNRRCYAMELDPIYCDVIIQRWEEYTGKKASLV